MKVKVDRKLQKQVLWYMLRIDWRVVKFICLPVMVVGMLLGRYVEGLSWEKVILGGLMIPGWMLADVALLVWMYLSDMPFPPEMYKNLGLPYPGDVVEEKT